MTPPLRVGLIGFGLGGAAFHAPLIATTPGLRLTTIVTANPDRQSHARREYPDASIVSSSDAVFARHDALDLVVISTPNRTHLPLAVSALEAGLPVVVDKPFTRTAAEGRRVVEEARRRKLMLTVYQNRRWDGELLTLRRLMADGTLGDVFRFESRIDRWRPAVTVRWRESSDPEDAGGILYDIGSHLIDQALLLFGPVSTVYAELDQRRPGTQVEDDVFLALAHTSGVRSHLWTSMLAGRPGPRMRVLGTRAAYVKELADVQEDALRRGERPDTPGWGEEPSERWGHLGVGDAVTPVRTEPGAYQRFYEGVAATLRDGAPPPVDPADAIAGLEIIEAARRSAAERQVVSIANVVTQKSLADFQELSS